MGLTEDEKMSYESIWKEVKDKKNVIGISRTLKKKIRKGKEIEKEAIRIYVFQKEHPSVLSAKDLIPEKIFGVPTDVIQIKKPVALSVDKTKAFRPVELGVSVGNWAITAGSLGMLYKVKAGNKIGLPEGKIVAGTNAHVGTPDPSQSVDQVPEKRILQPGAYHGGQTEANIVGQYIWHQQIFPDIAPATCPIGNGVASILNSIAKLFGRRTRLQAIIAGINNIDFAIYEPSIEHNMIIADGSLTDEPFIGHLFAGSTDNGIICKAKYIVDLGLEPLVLVTEVATGAKVKGCSFWCNYETTVFDDSAQILVGYGNFDALFDDIIIINNDGTVKGGWSGSGFRLIK